MDIRGVCVYQNGTSHRDADEEFPISAETPACTPVRYCGDSILQTGDGEACDPPGSPAGNNGNTCRANCTVCGDGRVDAGEVCDDGNGNNNDICRNDCTPPPPQIAIRKFTNGADANDPNAGGVPECSPGGTVTWRYDVTNPGLIPIPRADISVTDNEPGVNPQPVLVGGFVSGDVNTNNVLEPGETWIYQATGTCLNLLLPPPTGVIVTPNVCRQGNVNNPVVRPTPTSAP
jgi:hypothetical protein